MNNNKLPVNQIINRINDAADHNEAMVLTAEEVKILSRDIGDLYMIPHYTMEQAAQLHKDGKLGSPPKDIDIKD